MLGKLKEKSNYSSRTGLLALLRSCGKAPWGPLGVILIFSKC